MNDLDDYLEGFLDVMRSNGSTEATIKQYRYDLTFAQTRLLPKKKIAELKTADLRLAIAKLSKPEFDYKLTSIFRKVMCLRSFFKYLHESEYIEKNPALYLPTPKLGHKENSGVLSQDYFLKTILPYYKKKYSNRNKDLIRRINQNESQIQNSQLGPRQVIVIQRRIARLKKELDIRQRNERESNLLLIFLYASICRSVELIRLQVKDINLDTRDVKLQGKGNKDRHMILHKIAINQIREVIEADNLRPDNYLFRTKENKPYTCIRSIEKKIATIRKNLKLDYDLSPHKFRRNGITHLYQQGMPPEKIQPLAGHANIGTTIESYIKQDQTDIVNTYDRVNPLNKMEHDNDKKGKKIKKGKK